MLNTMHCALADVILAIRRLAQSDLIKLGLDKQILCSQHYTLTTAAGFGPKKC